MDVVVVSWPEEASRIEGMAADGVPRLLLVGPDADPATHDDPLEDWVRLPPEDHHVRTRVAVLRDRASRVGAEPPLGEDGRLSYRGEWIALSRTEAGLAAALLEDFGSVVS